MGEQAISLGQKSCRTKVSRIFRIFVPNFAPNFHNSVRYFGREAGLETPVWNPPLFGFSQFRPGQDRASTIKTMRGMGAIKGVSFRKARLLIILFIRNFGLGTPRPGTGPEGPGRALCQAGGFPNFGRVCSQLAFPKEGFETSGLKTGVPQRHRSNHDASNAPFSTL